MKKTKKGSATPAESKPPMRSMVAEPSVLILEEKHEKLYFHIPDDAALFETALMILKGRLSINYYTVPSDEYKPADPGLTKEQVEKITPEPLRKEAAKILHNYERDLRVWESMVDEYKCIEKAISDKDGRLAWYILRKRSSFEYEGVRLECYSQDYF